MFSKANCKKKLSLALIFTVYVDIGNQASDTATLNFAFATASTIRNWEIKVTQIECSNPGRYLFYVQQEQLYTTRKSKIINNNKVQNYLQFFFDFSRTIG